MHTEQQSATTFTQESDSALGALARCRQTVMSRANDLLDPAPVIPLTERYDALPSMTGLLMTSLEELKVAEEELREQNLELVRQRDEREAVVEHYRQLFQYAPVPAFITDIYGTIAEANLAAAALFKRDAHRLVRKPLAAMLAANGRDEFRRRLTRVAPDRRVDDWRLTFQRTGDEPVTVHAAVAFVPGVGPTRNGMLYWLVRVEQDRTD